MIEITVQRLAIALAVFITIQGIGIIKAHKWGDLLYYYIPVTLLAAVGFWATVVFYPAII